MNEINERRVIPMYTQLSDHEKEIALKYQLGRFLKIDEIPCKNPFAPNKLVDTLCLGFMIAFFPSFGLLGVFLFIIEVLSKILELLHPKLLSSPSFLSLLNIRENPSIGIVVIGVIWICVLLIFFVSSNLKYDERIVAFEHGFYQNKLSLGREKEIHHRYEEIKYLRISCCRSANGSQTKDPDLICYHYYTGNSQKTPFGDVDVPGCSSESQVLFKLVRKLLKSRLIPQIMADLQSGKEVDFNELKVSYQGIRTNQKSFYATNQIKELKFYPDSDDDRFELVPKPEFKDNKNWGHWGNRNVNIGSINNPNLFLEVLDILKIPVNCDAFPELANIK
ncbi:hypothetical protein WJM97_05695 [Okeanomitos corallinicola TIOX110]|uniref:Uncharacterized protein n=1 Tax=Okeanomitos corallinicola TIOX110 TaxID=3133117 RepID=A0ABZ2V0H4_9CYAN